MPKHDAASPLLVAILLLAVPIAAIGSATATSLSPRNAFAPSLAASSTPSRQPTILSATKAQEWSALVRESTRNPTPAASPIVGAGWDGVSFSTSGWTPPDVQVAVGPTNVVETVNLRLAAYTKQGGLIADYDLATFFGTGSDYITDPQVQHDGLEDRWFVTVADGSTGQVLIAVSETGNPAGAWWFYAAPGSPTGNCPDQPILGVGAVNIIFSFNLFSNGCQSSNYTYLGAQFWVVNKTHLITGAPSASAWASTPELNYFSIHPARMEGETPTQYMVATYWPGSDVTSNLLQLFKVSGSPPGTVSVTEEDLPMPTAALAPSAPQRGSTNLIDSGDIRIADAVWDRGVLWLGFAEECVHPGGSATACIRLMELDTAGGGTILQDFTLASGTQHYFYPALALDSLLNLVVVFGYSSSDDYPGIMTTGRLAGDPPGVLQPPILVKAGIGAETTLCDLGICRYGDYFGAGPDPADSSLLWFAGEVGRGAALGWGTHVFSVRLKAMLTLSYVVSGSDLPLNGPTLHYVLNGVDASETIATVPTTFLVDPGTAWSVDANVTSSSNHVRYVLLPSEIGNLSGTADHSFSKSIAYKTQYLVTVGPRAPLPASFVQGGGWFDAGSIATISASGNSSWHFREWVGTGISSYSGQNPNATFAVLGPIDERATFDPGLIIRASSGGFVTYGFNGTSGVVPSGGARTVFVPLGSLVTLTAQPESLAWTFSRWTGDLANAPFAASIAVNAPIDVTAVFDPNWIFLSGTPVAILSAALFVVVLLRRKKRRGATPPPLGPSIPSSPPPKQSG